MPHVNILRQNQRGATMIMVAVAMVVLLGFAVLAIDLSLLQLSKTQLQNAADAAALAGAIQFGISDGDQAAAATEAIRLAALNRAIQTTQQPVVIGAGDVSFPEPSKVRVSTHRTRATGDPLRIYFMRVLSSTDDNLSDMSASATAELTPVGGTDCLKPWVFPDRWDDTNGDSLWQPGEYYDPNTTGYRVPDDVGRTITVKYSSGGSTPKMGWYQPIRFGAVNRGGPDCTGADCYRTYISECEPYTVYLGDTLQFESGNMVGPTRQGWEELVAKDPTARFNASTGTIENSAYAVSPRMIKLALYDPTVSVITSGASGAEKNIVVAKFAYLFIEAPPESGSNVAVTARFLRYASSGMSCASCPEGFLFTARLVE